MLSYAFMWSLIALSPVHDLIPPALNLPQPPKTVERLAASRTTAPENKATATGMSCVASRCGSQLQECVKDPTCLRGLGCFVTCSTNPSSGSATVGEGACQVRCVDLYESDKLNALTKCTLTDNSCYPALKADPRYPPLPSHLAETVDASQLRQLLTGRWYVSAGLNPAFDTFACQVHDFTTTSVDEKALSNSKLTTIPIADATFSYRVDLDSTGREQVTRVGQKRLYLKMGNSGDSDASDAMMLSFRRGKAWGRDSFDLPAPSSTHPTLTNEMAPERQVNKKSSGAQLALTTIPDYMDYEDEWTILSACSMEDTVDTASLGRPVLNQDILRQGAYAVPSSSAASSPPHPSTDFMVVAYRGSNAAWRGYGGLNVYTREPVDFTQLVQKHNQQQQSSATTTTTTTPLDGDEAALLRGIQRGLDKVGLKVADLLPVDHASSCGSN